ncbi:hypothetical protein ACLMJK_009408 [Lecanora helva]
MAFIPATPEAQRVITDLLEEEFVDSAQVPDHLNKPRLTHCQRREIKSFLSDLNRKPRSQQEHSMKYRAKKHFILVGGQLYRKAGDELEDDEYQAAARQPPHVIMVKASYRMIRRIHEIIGLRAGVDKTWKEVQRQYYSLNKSAIAWVIRNYEACQVNTSSNIQAPVQEIRSSHVNERWCIDLTIFARGHGADCAGCTTAKSNLQPSFHHHYLSNLQDFLFPLFAFIADISPLEGLSEYLEKSLYAILYSLPPLSNYSNFSDTC